MQVLGLDPREHSTVTDIGDAFKDLSVLHHPDRPHDHGRSPKATAEFQKIQAAYGRILQQLGE